MNNSRRTPIVGVMGSGSESWEDYTQPLGRWIAESGFHLLTGGGGGVMQSVSAAFISARTGQNLSIGVIPTEQNGNREYSPKPGYPNPYIDLPIISPLSTFDGTDPNQVSRNYINILTATMIVALPGSKGTINEVMLAERFSKPVILFGPLDSFKLFPDQVQRTDSLTTVTDWIRKFV